MHTLPRLLDNGRAPLFLGLFFNGLCQSIIVILSALSLRGLVDTMLAESYRGSDFLGPIGVLISCTLFQALLRWQERVKAETLGQSYVFDLRLTVFEHLGKLSSRAFSGTRKGMLITRFVSDLGSLKNWISIGIARSGVGVVSTLGCLIALIVIQPWIGLSVAATISTGGLALLYSGKRMDELVRETRRRRGHLSANITEKLHGMATIQAFARQRRERTKVRRQSQRLMQAMQKNASVTGAIRAGAHGVAGLSTTVAISVGAWCVANGTATAGDVVAALGMVSMLSPNLFLFGRLYQLSRTAKVATERTQALLKKGPLIESPGKSSPPTGLGELHFDNVAVSDSLEPFSGTAKPGQHIAIRGLNGTGKSTLLHLAIRLIDPDSGSVTLDGIPLTKMSNAQLRKHIALVSTDLPLLRGTVLYNLTYGIRGETRQRLRRVARLCKLDLVSEDSVFYAKRKVQESGQNFSKGERMRLLLARALLMEPAVLLVDEADAGLDLQGMRLLKKIVSEYKGTVLFVSHRRALINCADTVWCLDQKNEETENQPLASTERINAKPANIRVVHM